MKNKNIFLQLSIVFITSVFFSCSDNSTKEQNPIPPVAEKIFWSDTTLGDVRIDNYYWLREKENPKVMDYLKAENKYTDEMTAHLNPLKEKLFAEMKGRIKETDMNVPYKLDSFYYYSRMEEGKEYSVHCRKKKNMEAAEEILLDENAEAKNYNYFDLGEFEVSPNHQILAYCIDTSGSINYTFYFKDLASGKLLPEIIYNSGSLAWANDNKTIFYSQKDPTNRDYRIFRHELGSDLKNDVLVYEEPDETFEIYVYKTKSKEYLVIHSNQTLSSEVWILKSNEPKSKFKLFQKRERDHEYHVAHYQDKFYITTNWNAKNFRLMETPVSKTEKSNWKELIPAREKVKLEDVEIFSDYLVATEREEGLLKIRVKKWKDNQEYYLEFPEKTYSAYVGYNPDFNTNQLRYFYSSLTTPSSVYEYDMSTKNQKLLKQWEVLGGFNSADYQSERLYAKASDGTLVPLSIVYKKGLQKNGNNPCLLTGYGSYGSSYDVYFSSTNLSLLNRGFVFAIAHIRGGEEMGRQWYEDGKLLKKKNTFTDFIACAEHLVAEKFTTKEKLCITGGSAGGLLMGAVTNMRPDLFKAVVAEVPFVDVITTMLDASIPLTTLEWDEWGNPNNKEYYDYMKSYSPYDNVGGKNYPAMLVRTALNDAQVRYFEPAKWVAKLRAMKTDNNPLLFYIDMSSGHGGPSGRFTALKDNAFQFAFMLDEVGVKE